MPYPSHGVLGTASLCAISSAFISGNTSGPELLLGGSARALALDLVIGASRSLGLDTSKISSSAPSSSSFSAIYTSLSFSASSGNHSSSSSSSSGNFRRKEWATLISPPRVGLSHNRTLPGPTGVILYGPK